MDKKKIVSRVATLPRAKPTEVFGVFITSVSMLVTTEIVSCPEGIV